MLRSRALGAIRRRFLQNPGIACSIILFVLGSALYFALWRLALRNDGRWYWNWVVSLHPALALVIPSGDWGPIENPPRFIPEVYNAPWMGTWDLPKLSRPVYRKGPVPSTGPNPPSNITSPVLVKLHVFSTVWPKAAAKRKLVRELSVLKQLPCPYRHLVEIKFVLGHAYKADWAVDEEIEAELKAEQEEYGDLIRLDLEHGENLREGKILEWVRAAGTDRDGGSGPGWLLFRVDDDAVLNLPNFLDVLLSLNPHQAYYLGTSLNRWPAFHHHFTGMVTGFSYSVVKTLAFGIDQLSWEEKIRWFDDDVMTGEIMFGLPSAPHCRRPIKHDPTASHEHHYTLPDYCDVHKPQPYGYLAPPPAIDPRSGLIRYDCGRHMGDYYVWFVSGNIARHGGRFKPVEGYREEWEQRIKGRMWTPPRWLEQFADPHAKCDV